MEYDYRTELNDNIIKFKQMLWWLVDNTTNDFYIIFYAYGGNRNYWSNKFNNRF